MEGQLIKEHLTVPSCEKGVAVGVGTGEGPSGAAVSLGWYLTVASVARAVHICEVLPIGIHQATVGTALAAGAAGT